MKIEITKNKTIEDIQKEFNNQFPYLKLSFFGESHKAFKGSLPDDLIQVSTKMGDLTSSTGAIIINENMSVNELEQLFKTALGLNVQVFRRSGNSWLETTVTDNWSLKKQNHEGLELSKLNM